MPRNGNIDRRRFLKAAGGAAVATTVAGCQGAGSNDGGTATETTSGEETSGDTDTESGDEEGAAP
ncbi:twin-arginine translocation signal domain-containing protein [Haloarculaceae archaeon H-GB11]|nr:twin-arginine translocation signal domain-containing protein [Haloarculaceae archaeon H-GB11]